MEKYPNTPSYAEDLNSPPSYSPGTQVLAPQAYPMYAYGQPVVQTQPNINVSPNQQNSQVVSISTAPAPIVTQQPSKEFWNASLCSCCTECSVCMCGCCFLPCYSCALADRMGENCLLGCCCPGPLAMRTQLRVKHHIHGSACDDCCIWAWCFPCMICQMGHEMNSRDYPKTCCGCC